ncbi:MAG: hypothetical protein AB8H86_23625 [Polyangiales bacterium]
MKPLFPGGSDEVVRQAAPASAIEVHDSGVTHRYSAHALPELLRDAAELWEHGDVVGARRVLIAALASLG